MDKRKTAAPIGASMLVLSSVFFATYGIWTTLMGNFFGGYTTSALRSIIVLLILFPIALAYRKLGSVNLKRNWKYLTGMLVSSALIWGPFYYAILHAGVGIAVAINYACFVIGMFFFGWLFARERFTKDKWLSCSLGFIGMCFVFTPSVGHLGWVALVAAAISGVGMASNTVMAKQLPYNATQSTLFLWITSVIANVCMAVLIGEHLPSFEWHAQWLYLFIFAIASVIASWLFIVGLKLIEAGAAGILGLLEIVFGVLFGYICFSERIGFIALLGVLVIIGAAAIPYIKDYNAKRGTLDEAK